jgi:hypothetical protein
VASVRKFCAREGLKFQRACKENGMGKVYSNMRSVSRGVRFLYSNCIEMAPFQNEGGSPGHPGAIWRRTPPVNYWQALQGHLNTKNLGDRAKGKAGDPEARYHLNTKCGHPEYKSWVIFAKREEGD